MNDKRTSLEIIAPSVEEAVAQGLDELGLTEDDVEIEILDMGSKGVFGLGTRQSRVRLTVKPSPHDDLIAPRAKISTPIDERAPDISVQERLDEIPDEIADGLSKEDDTPRVEEVVTESGELVEEVIDEDEQAVRVARETVIELLERMKVNAEVSAYWGVPDDEQSRRPLRVDIHGEDLSILIGRRAETLNAFQYIVGLIVGKELGRSTLLIVDVEGYRERRSEQIRRLARRMADQAVQTGRRQVCEPMPPNERRLMHIELRKDPNVTTESIGEGSSRKVTIIPEGLKYSY
jgi:spoIIIJ-associated protein